MRVFNVAICTIAAITAADFTHQATAAPNDQSANPKLASGNYVVPVKTTATPTPSIVIAPPQAQTKPEFSQKASPLQTAASSRNSSDLAVPNINQISQKVAPTQTAVTTTSVSSGTTVQPQTQTKPQFSQNSQKVSPIKTAARAANSDGLAVTTTDLQVVGANDELQQIVRNTIHTHLGSDTSQSQLDKDVQAILATSLFTDAHVTSFSNSTGLKVVYQVQPVVVRSLQLVGAQVLTPAVANNFFKAQFGATVSPNALRQSIEQINQWYKQNGYAVAQVLALRPNNNGVITVEVAEGVVGDVKIRFLDKDGNPTKGRTKEDFISRQLKLKPGQLFRTDVVQQDLQQLAQTGLFEHAKVSLDGDARKVNVSYDITEQPARAVNVGGGYSGDAGLFGTLSYKDQNLGGVNQQLGANVQLSTRDVQFDGKLTNPYLASNPDRPGYSINVFRRRGLSDTFSDDITLPNGDQAREGRFGGGVTFTRPVSDWQASLGLNYARTSIRDGNGNLSPVDVQGHQLSFSGTGIDDLVTVSAGVTKDLRDNPVNPTKGSVLSFTTEQSVPVGMGNILMNRVQANYSQYVPVGLLSTSDKKDVLAFNLQGGTTIGDLPPYQAFNLGGINSVRGYGTDQLASGRSYVLATAEYRFPIYKPIGGVLFADFGSDLGTADTVPGEPGVARDKQGTGVGYGAGLRINSPVGIIRADYAFNDQGESRLQFGIGQRF